MGLFSGIVDSLFGKEPETKQISMSRLTPNQQAKLDQLLNELTIGGAADPSVPGYSAPMVADLSKLERTSLAGLEQRALQYSSGSTPEQTLAMETLKSLIEGQPIANDEFIRTQILDPTSEFVTEELLPAFTRRFSGNAAFGSDRQKAESEAMQNLIKETSRTIADVKRTDAATTIQNQLAALGLLPQVQAGGTDEMLKLLTAGAQPRSVDQGKLTAAYEEWKRQQTDKASRRKDLLAALGIPTQDNAIVQNEGKDSILADVIGGFLGGKVGRL